MKTTFTEILDFLKRHWIHWLIAIPMLIGWTVFHELAHCLAVWLQGGTVTEFVWLPSGATWGHMSYPNSEFSPRMEQLVSLAPYLIWTAIGLASFLLALWRQHKPMSFKVTSTIYVWLFILPTADTANAAIPYLLWNSHNDFLQAFGNTTPFITVAIVLLGFALLAVGFVLNRLLYREFALGLPGYLILAALATMGVTGITWGG